MQPSTSNSVPVPPDSQVLPIPAKCMSALRAVFFLGVMLALASQATAAPVVFQVSGGNPDESGMVLYGTVTIDTATGKVLSADVTVAHVLYDGGFTEYVLDQVEAVRQTTYVASRGGPVEVLTQISILTGYDGPSLYLTLEGSLVGYKGSPLFSSRIPLDFASYIEFPGTPYGWSEYPVFGSVEPN
jgi:hypothetical protein